MKPTTVEDGRPSDLNPWNLHGDWEGRLSHTPNSPALFRRGDGRGASGETSNMSPKMNWAYCHLDRRVRLVRLSSSIYKGCYLHNLHHFDVGARVVCCSFDATLMLLDPSQTYHKHLCSPTCSTPGAKLWIRMIISHASSTQAMLIGGRVSCEPGISYHPTA